MRGIEGQGFCAVSALAVNEFIGYTCSQRHNQICIYIPGGMGGLSKDAHMKNLINIFINICHNWSSQWQFSSLFHR